MWIRTLLLVTAVAFPLLSFAQSGMPTIEAARFAELEKRLAQAQQQRDLAALRLLVADDFELRDAANSSELTLRDDWFQSVMDRKSKFCTSRELMPRIFGDTAAISFVCETAHGRRFFAVDIWQKSGSQWRLAARYLAAAGAAPAQDVKTRQ